MKVTLIPSKIGAALAIQKLTGCKVISTKTYLDQYATLPCEFKPIPHFSDEDVIKALTSAGVEFE